MRLESLTMVRHGESTGNVARAAALLSGAEEIDLPLREADVPLSELGRIQAAAVGEWLGGLPDSQRPDQVVASPYLRTRETAEIALKTIGSPEVRLDERLRDRDGGVFYGLTFAGIKARYPAEVERFTQFGKFYYRPPEGESWTDVALRLRAVLTELDQEFPGERMLVFAHDVIIVLARYVLGGLTEAEIMEIEKTPVANCSVSQWINDEGRPRMIHYNSVEHLSPDITGQ
jgi:probable phosphoglycerate mutase